jgi:hypothetical protein
MWAFARRPEPLYFPAVNRPPARTHSHNGNHQKINPESVAYFSTPKYDYQFTTKSPQSHHKFTIKNHVKPPVFPKTPSTNIKDLWVSLDKDEGVVKA